MERVNVVKEYVYSKYANIYNENIRIAALTHTASVESLTALLCISRTVNQELALIAALLHDYALFVDNCLPKEHARIGSLEAYKYLKSTELFTDIEIEDITYAIGRHSRKDQYDSPLCEVLKDADLLAKFLENPKDELKDYEKRRLIDAMSDLK